MKIKGQFPFASIFCIQIFFFYPGGFQGLTKRNNIYHFKAPVWIVITNSVSLNFVQRKAKKVFTSLIAMIPSSSLLL